MAGQIDQSQTWPGRENACEILAYTYIPQCPGPRALGSATGGRANRTVGGCTAVQAFKLCHSHPERAVEHWHNKENGEV
jgi:hypothetical protein